MTPNSFLEQWCPVWKIGINNADVCINMNPDIWSKNVICDVKEEAVKKGNTNHEVEWVSMQ